MKELAAIPLLILAGCVTVAPQAAPQTIIFETGPCFGACPVYRVAVRSDGNGSFEGRQFTAVPGHRNFNGSPAHFEAFARHLAPLRPAQGSIRYAGEACDMLATDLPSADVTWREADGTEQHLHFYYGCDMDRNRAIAERLSAAPDLLPIAELIGTRE